VNAPNVVSVRCHYCSVFRNPHEVFPIGIGGVVMCLRCREWHDANIDALAKDGAPKGCFECRVTWAELRLRLEAGDNPAELKMFLVPKDGIYQLLCRTCSDAYERKRADLLRGTLYGQRKGV
jgi:hypothetical protein